MTLHQYQPGPDAPAALAADRVRSAKPAKPGTLREFEAALEALGFSRREARSIAAHGFSAVAAVATDDSTDILAAIRAAVHELKG